MRSMKRLTFTSRANFQKDPTNSHRSSRAEYPFTRAPCTDSESTKSSTEASVIWSLNVSSATTVANISTIEIWDFRGNHWSMSFWDTSPPNWTGWHPNLKKTPPIHGLSGEPSLPSGKLPSVKMTASAFFADAIMIGLGGPCWISHFQCSRDFTRALFRCLSDKDLRKALPIFPHSWEAPNMSFPRSLPAWPGGSSDESRMESISSCSSSFLLGLILKHIDLKSYVTPKIVGSSDSCNFLASNCAPSQKWTLCATWNADRHVVEGSNPYLSS